MSNLESTSETEWDAVFRKQQQGKKAQKAKREPFGDPADVGGYKGPWASYERTVLPVSREQQLKAAKDLAQKNPLFLLPDQREKSEGGEYSILHEPDRAGFAPFVGSLDGPRADDLVPRRIVHTWTGHSQGVYSVELFPRTAHLLLSCSLDHKIKIWDYYGQRRCLRTYFGHAKPVRSVSFSPDGSQFLSCGFDKQLKLWDTETGKCVKSWPTDDLPFIVKFHPQNRNEFLVATNDNKVHKYASNELVRTFEGHLCPVNSVTFLDDAATLLLTTSDDKTMRLWNYADGSVQRYISLPPSIASVVSVAVHPGEPGQLAAQSSLCKIVTFQHDSLDLSLQSKHFFGHKLNGYICPVSFSPCGTYLSSGDGEGNVITWEWKRALFQSKLPVHAKPVVGMQWHPHDDTLVTCSLDGSIKIIGQ